MYVVTGGAGFIGSHLCDRLQAKAVDDLSFSSKEFVSGPFVEADVCDVAAVRKAVEGAEAVLHFAAAADVRDAEADPTRAQRVNVLGTRCVLEACRDAGVEKLVFASTAAVYGSRETPADESAALNPQSAYAASKAEAEAFLKEAAGRKLRVSVLRFGNVFGPRSRRGVMFDFYRKLLKDPGHMEVLGDGFQTKSYVYVSDVVDAVVRVLEGQRTDFEVFNVPGHERDVNAVVRAVCAAMQLDPELSFTGGMSGWKGDVPRTKLDGGKLNALGWMPQVGFDQGVALYVDWLKKHG